MPCNAPCTLSTNLGKGWSGRNAFCRLDSAVVRPIPMQDYQNSTVAQLAGDWVELGATWIGFAAVTAPKYQETSAGLPPRGQPMARRALQDWLGARRAHYDLRNAQSEWQQSSNWGCSSRQLKAVISALVPGPQRNHRSGRAVVASMPISSARSPKFVSMESRPGGRCSVVHLVKPISPFVVAPFDKHRTMPDVGAILAPSFEAHMCGG